MSAEGHIARSTSSRLGWRRVGLGAVLILASVAIGLGSAWWAVTRGSSEVGWTRDGAWESGRDIGTAATDPYSRARVALYGLWALPASEVVYFLARTDSSGQSLSVRCRYVIEGSELPARWWSLTVYRDFHYIDTPARRYSRHSQGLVRTADGRFRITLDREGRGENGLPLGTLPGVIALNLRLYQPALQGPAERDTLDLPQIIRTGCDP